jgi:hypothetical protein
MAPCWFENLNERERKGKRATAARPQTRDGGVANARRRRGERATAAWRTPAAA